MTQTISPPSALVVSSKGLLPLWQWWTAELRAMLPAPMARWIDGDNVAINVSVEEHGLTILNSSAASANAFTAAHVQMEDFTSNPGLRDLIAAGRDRVRLILTPDQVMVKSITLPLATEENLREVVGFELDRHTPFTPDQAYYDVQVLRRDPPHEKILVTLVVASKSAVAALLDTLRRAGLTCTAIGIHEVTATNSAAVDLQPEADKPPRRLSRAHQVNLGLLGLAALLAVAAVVLPIWQKREAIKMLIPQAEKAGAEFKLSDRVYTEYTKLAAEYNFLAARKHAVYPVVLVLEELARTFPDTTWVQKLDIKFNGKVREVTILGEAQSTSKVIENLEQSPMSLFQNSKQQSQTTRLQPNTERFHVSAEIKPRAAPTPEGIDAVAAQSSTTRFDPALAPFISTPAASSPAVGSVAPVFVSPMLPAPPAGTTVLVVPPAKKGVVPAPIVPNPALSTFNGPPVAPMSTTTLPASSMPTEKRNGP